MPAFTTILCDPLTATYLYVHSTKQADITQFDFDSGHKYVLVPHTDGPRVFLTTLNNNNRKRVSEFRIGSSWIVLYYGQGRGQAI